MKVLALLFVASLALADKPVFPTDGAKLTFTSAQFKDTWSTQLVGTGGRYQYKPHNDTLNYFSKAGFEVRADGIYIVGEVMAELDQTPPAPALAIAFPFKTGASHVVPGMIPTTYTVGKKEKAGHYDAWKIAISDKPNGSGAVWIAPGVGVVKIQQPSGRIDELVH